MQLASFQKDGVQRFGVIKGEQIIEKGPSLRGFLGHQGKEIVDILGLNNEEGRAYPLDEVQLLPPVPDPAKLLCIAGNYLAHLRESGEDVEDTTRITPQIFLKPPTTTLRAHEEPLALPKVTTSVDWEVELAIVIGRRGRYIPENRAYEHILGYSVFNDISDRDLDIKPKSDREERPWDPYYDWFAGKCMDGFAPFGPVIVTRDQIPDPHALGISLTLNGKIMQESKTSLMMSSVPELLSYISHIMTLEPGDVIATGTPHGVGWASGTYLKPRDVMEAEIEGLGVLRTPVIEEPGVSASGKPAAS